MESELDLLQATTERLSRELVIYKCITCCELPAPCGHVQYCKPCAAKHVRKRSESREHASMHFAHPAGQESRATTLPPC